MFDILFARTFFIVGGMLIITAITSRINKETETLTEFWISVIGLFGFLFAIVFFADVYPLNLVLIAIFSGFIGWIIGPSIVYLGKRYTFRQYLKSKGVSLKKGQEFTLEQKNEFENSFDSTKYSKDWRNIVFQALLATSLAVVSTAAIVFLTSIDFSFLQGFLYISLIILILMGLLNAFFFRSSLISLIKAYVGAVIFTLYLLFDFDRLEKMAGDESWGAAINIAVSIYLDIINLFLDILEILAESD